MAVSLDKLHDIYLPESIGFEFLTGHMLVSLFLLACLVSLVYFLVDYSLATRFKRRALKELRLYQEQNDISAVFELIKRVLLTVYRRDEVAGLSGSELIDFIGADEAVLKVNRSLYNRAVKLSEKEKSSFYKEIRHWIKKQGPLYD